MDANGLLHEYYWNKGVTRSKDRIQIIKAKHAICESEIELHKFRQAKGDSDKLQERLKTNDEVMQALEIAESLLSECDSLNYFNKKILRELDHAKQENEKLKEQIEFTNK